MRASARRLLIGGDAAIRIPGHFGSLHDLGDDNAGSRFRRLFLETGAVALHDLEVDLMAGVLVLKSGPPCTSLPVVVVVVVVVGLILMIAVFALITILAVGAPAPDEAPLEENQ